MLTASMPDVIVGGTIDAQALARKLSLPLQGLARLAGVSRNTIAAKPLGAKAKAALAPIIQILAAATEMAGSEEQAIIWFKYQPILAMGTKTAEQHVKDGHADIVLMHLESILNGVYA